MTGKKITVVQEFIGFAGFHSPLFLLILPQEFMPRIIFSAPQEIQNPPPLTQGMSAQGVMCVYTGNLGNTPSQRPWIELPHDL